MGRLSESFGRTSVVTGPASNTSSIQFRLFAARRQSITGASSKERNNKGQIRFPRSNNHSHPRLRRLAGSVERAREACLVESSELNLKP